MMDGVARIPYQQWILERVKVVKLPFSIEVPPRPPALELVLVSLEEVEELRDTMARLEKEKEDMHQELYKLTNERKDLRFDLN